MNNFVFQNPTKIIFGKNQISNLASEIANYGKNVLLVYGGGSIKRNGIYDKIFKQLADFNIVELYGVEPNPRVTTAQKGADLIKENNINFVLAVGGGSVIDCTKLIVAAAHYEGDAWDIVTRKHIPTKATPFGTILTLAATASEMNAGSVITNLETQQKVGWASPLVFPKFSILDPTYTFTLPKNQTVNGIVDMMSHICEQYFNEADNSDLHDAMMEGVLKQIIHYGPKCLENPQDYEARSVIMMAGTIALNGQLRWGFDGDWASHGLEHAVSAVFDIAHAEGLSILMPNWMKYVMPNHTAKFKKFAVNVFDVNTEGKTDQEIALEGINKLQNFWQEIGAPTKLTEKNIQKEDIPSIVNAIARPVGTMQPLSKEGVYKIYEMSL
ncbi:MULTISPECIES: iron-containing alcohol dehydrogenase [unclassified Gemella]|uniref:iron-containing alcohol dehydrogenase n=1 Tax=unclassified Gemella TaxID=2624949 RepID=UPI001C04B3AE|nr:MULTISPECIES: iron-containing alcohol dehydrogenase [unclassified Gemella]MBU0278997.1 iron-containing alcohol dehydrogenase [Gemella sp. zg-1178]QWQ38739.1 iron-containing alcohol dehydrogenase [Gemella sp. zg-570]